LQALRAAQRNKSEQEKVTNTQGQEPMNVQHTKDRVDSIFEPHDTSRTADLAECNQMIALGMIFLGRMIGTWHTPVARVVFH
jgi:hypothetical protein